MVGTPGRWTWLRVVHEGREFTAYTSQDGRRWVRGGTWRHDLGDNPRIELVAMGGNGFTATFDTMTTRALR